jgi:methionyl-tRNA formyltransferase
LKKRLKSFLFTEEAGSFDKEEKFSLVFMGTPEFACSPFEKIAEREKVVAVVTQPDKPRGRGKRLKPSPVKMIASQKGVPVYQPQNLEDAAFLKKITSLQPDLIVVVAFGRLLTPVLLNIPRIYCLNLHPSLLPEYRGPAPIPWVLIKGETKTGVTVQRMREKIDSGEIILQKTISIEPEDNTGTLTKKLSRLGAETLVEAINLIKKRKAKLKPQEGKGSYAPKITKEMGRINWKRSSEEIHNLVRGLNPHPGAFTTFKWQGREQLLKIWETAFYGSREGEEEISPGMIVEICKNKGFTVKTGKGLLLVREVQIPGRYKINAYDFIKGYHIKKGLMLGG